MQQSRWQLLLPVVNLRQRFWNAVAWLCGAVVALVPMPMHWVWVAGQHDTTAYVAWGVAAAVICGTGVVALRRWSVSRHMSDVRLRVRPVPLRRGEVIAVEAEADALSPLRVGEMSAKLVCIEHYKEKSGNKTSYGSRTHREVKVALAGAGQIAAGEVVAGRGEATLADCPPTTDITVKLYPYYTWEVRVAVKLEGMVDYAGVFPVEVV